MPPLQPVDLCVLCPPAGGWKAVRWTALMAPSRYAAIRNVASDVYWAMGHALCVCPMVEEVGEGGLQITWENDNRTLTVKVVPGRSLLVQRTVSASIEDPGWLEVPTGDSAVLSTTFFRHGRYLSGKKETECIPRTTA